MIGDDSGGRQEETAASRRAQLREAPHPQAIARRGCCFPVNIDNRGWHTRPTERRSWWGAAGR